MSSRVYACVFRSFVCVVAADLCSWVRLKLTVLLCLHTIHMCSGFVCAFGIIWFSIHSFAYDMQTVAGNLSSMKMFGNKTNCNLNAMLNDRSR